MDAHRLGMAVQLGCDLIGRLACPVLDDQLVMKLPISWRMMAVCELARLAFFLPILRRSGLHVFGHGSALSHPEPLPPPILIPMRNAALSGNLPLLYRELKDIDFRFPAFEPGIPVHVSLHTDKDGTYPLRQREAIIGILTNRAYIGWQVYNGVIVSREAHTAIVGIEDFMYAWERLSKVSLDGTEEQEKAVKERRYGGKNALLDGVLRSNELPVYVVRNHYVSSADNDGFSTYDMVVPVKIIDSAFARAMVNTLASLEAAHRRGLQAQIYQRVAEVQKEEEEHAVDYQESIARVDKEIRSQEMAQRVSREEGDEQGYREATKQLVLLRKDKSALEAKAKQSSSELSELKERGNLINCAIHQWEGMKIWQQK